MEEILPIAMPGTHQKFMEFFKKRDEPVKLKVLDLGAGHGALTKKLHEMGYDVYACDLFPELFKFDKVECKKADITSVLPYSDNTFDLIIAVEVSEHICNHDTFFSETSRILKQGGKLYISTPNILSLKSRMKFLLGGFAHSFGKLELRNQNGLQHVASLTLDQYNYVAVKNNYYEAEYEIDRRQRSSKWLLIFLFPAFLLYGAFNKTGRLHNNIKLLLGRLIFMIFVNNKTNEKRN